MRIKVVIAASVMLFATSNSRAEASNACILKATESLHRISGLVIKKTRTRPVPAEILAKWKGQTRPIIVDVDIVAGRNLFIPVRSNQRLGLRAPGDELASKQAVVDCFNGQLTSVLPLISSATTSLPTVSSRAPIPVRAVRALPPARARGPTTST